MKPQISIYIFLISVTLIVIAGCGKNNTQEEAAVPVDYSNIDLKNKTVAIIQTAVKGRWQHIKDSIFGWAGWDVIYPQNRYISFLPSDSLKVEYNGAVTLYDKGSYIWGRSVHTADSVYTFTIPGRVNWVADKIFNDTLKIDAWPDIMYLIKIN